MAEQKARKYGSANKGKNVRQNAGSVRKSASQNAGSVKRSEKKRASQNAGSVKKNVQKNASGVCPYAKDCGGCDYQGMEYAAQLKEKQEYVRKQVGAYCKVLPIIGMEQPYHYRNKVHAVFDIARGGNAGRGKGVKNGKAPAGAVISGVYKAGTHDVVNIDACQIEDETADAIIRDIRGLLRSFKIKTYDEDTGYGLLRHVLVRRGFHSGEVMVVLVLGSDRKSVV